MSREFAPWWFVRPGRCATPGMITWEESRYYYWLGRFFSGAGEAVELGCWLGRSTYFILRGLQRSPHFSGRRLHAFDDFIWRSSWMDKWFSGPDKPGNHESFRPLFEQYTTPLIGQLAVEQRRIGEYEGNASVPQLSWSGGRIEFLYIDCGTTFAVNEAWWRVFMPWFIPGRTLLIMQDWQSYKEMPPKPYNQTKQFTDSKENALRLIHEIRHGGIGTFLYTGRRDTCPAGVELPAPEVPVLAQQGAERE